MQDEITVDRTGDVTQLTLNRPEKVNVLSSALVEQLITAVERCAQDETRLMVLRGEGRHFSAGFDFSDLDSCSDGDLALRFLRIETLLQLIRHAPFGTLALAHGRAVGAGADLVVACEARVADPGAHFRFPGLAFDVVLGTRRLAQRIGDGAALAMLLAGAETPADAALRTGLLTDVAPRAEWGRVIDGQATLNRRLSRSALAALRERTRHDDRAEDMAALARSVSVPGLRARMQRYRAQPPVA